jgi:hypothetical protein
MSENFPVYDWKIASGAIGFDRVINAFLNFSIPKPEDGFCF